MKVEMLMHKKEIDGTNEALNIIFKDGYEGFREVMNNWRRL